MKNNNLKDFVTGLKKIEDPNKVNSELQKIRAILDGKQKTIKDNYTLDLKLNNSTEIQKEEMKKIKLSLRVQ